MAPLAHTPATTHHELITDHVSMALRMARRMAYRLPQSVSREDVEGAALLGLTEAAYRYDDSRDEPFVAYASKRVRGAIQDYLRCLDHLTRRRRRDARRMTDTMQRLESYRGQAVTEADVAAELGVSVDEVYGTFTDLHVATTVHLDDLAAASIASNDETPVECIERHEMRTALVHALESLDPRSLLIMALYYQEGLTLREIGTALKLTESRVCQLHTEALRTLRVRLD